MADDKAIENKPEMTTGDAISHVYEEIAALTGTFQRLQGASTAATTSPTGSRLFKPAQNRQGNIAEAVKVLEGLQQDISKVAKEDETFGLGSMATTISAA